MKEIIVGSTMEYKGQKLVVVRREHMVVKHYDMVSKDVFSTAETKLHLYNTSNKNIIERKVYNDGGEEFIYVKLLTKLKAIPKR